MNNAFRNADWLTPQRIMLWAKCFFAVWLLFLAVDGVAHTTHGYTDAAGEHIGRDFINYWSGAQLAAAGKAALAYDVQGYLDFQKSVAGALSELKIYSYPPVAMLLTLPLALTSFMAGYVLWCVIAYALVALLLMQYMERKKALILALALPASFINVESGQNGAFTAALLAGGLMLLERKPVVAGVLIGLLCYKPQLGLLLPLALTAGGYWRSFFSAGVTVVALVAVSSFAFGHDIWWLFLEQMKKQTVLMEQGETLWHRMPSVFAGVRLAGGGVTLAYIAQGLGALAAVIAVVKAWRTKAALPLKSAVLVLAMFLATPYSWDYDMIAAVFALLWVAQDAQAKGWQPWEKFCWLLLILMPFFLPPLGKFLYLQPGALVVAACLWLTLRRAEAFK